MTRTCTPLSPRRDTYGSMASAAIGNPLPAQVAGLFDRSDYTSPGRRPRPIHGNATFPASTRRRSKTCRDPFAASSMTAQSRCSSTSRPPWMAHNRPAPPGCARGRARPRVGGLKRREFRLELAESRHIVPEWTTHRGAVCGQGWADPVFEDYARLPRIDVESDALRRAVEAERRVYAKGVATPLPLYK